MRQAVIGRSVRGAAHVRSGTECQDRFRRHVCEDGTLILAAADGHGSAASPWSGTGARMAVNVFCDVLYELHHAYCWNQDLLRAYLSREGDSRVAREIDRKWKERVLRFHRQRRRPWPDEEAAEEGIWRQYGTTLLGLMAAPEFVFVLQVGDGDICMVRDGAVTPLLEPARMLGVETDSLCRRDAWKKMNTGLYRIRPAETLPTVFTLSTDGLCNSYPDDAAFRQTLKEYAELVPRHGVRTVREHLTGWLNETSRLGCGDDITLVMGCWWDG